MTLYENEMINAIHSAPDKEYALAKAIEIIETLKAQPLTSQEPPSACPWANP